MKKQCQCCGSTYEADKHNRKYCSVACYRKARWGSKRSETRQCVWCGNTFRAYINNSRRAEKYCSVDCYRQDRERPILRLICPTCGKTFKTQSPKTYCSRQCYFNSGAPKPGARNRIEHKCEWCGKAFTRPASYFQRSNQHFFCSHRCSSFWWSHYGVRGSRHPAWKGGVLNAAYRTQWHRARKAVLSTAGSTCSECGTRRKRLLVHHIIPADEFNDPREANKLNNLKAVCDKCHKALHRELRLAAE